MNKTFSEVEMRGCVRFIAAGFAASARGTTRQLPPSVKAISPDRSGLLRRSTWLLGRAKRPSRQGTGLHCPSWQGGVEVPHGAAGAATRGGDGVT